LILRTHSRLGDSVFADASPQVCNGLPFYICQSDMTLEQSLHMYVFIKIPASSYRCL